MGILNLTPDSFSDGTSQASLKDFLKKAEQLIADGVDILDIGGESTRPQAKPVTLEEEIKRVIPFLKAFRTHFPDFPISLDTKKYQLACEAMSYGIQVINDVSFLSDTRFLDLMTQSSCYYVLMHSRGDSQTMMNLTDYPEGIVSSIKSDFEKKIALCSQFFPRERLILDLGFGFSKTSEQCLTLLEDLSIWKSFELPLLFGISRKRFLNHFINTDNPSERDQISAILAKKAIEQGFDIIRTHNVRLTQKTINNNSSSC